MSDAAEPALTDARREKLRAVLRKFVIWEKQRPHSGRVDSTVRTQLRNVGR